MDGVSYRCNTQMVSVHKSRRYHHRQCRKRPMLLSRLGKFKQKNHAIFFPQIIVWTAIIDRYLGRLSTVNIETVVFFIVCNSITMCVHGSFDFMFIGLLYYIRKFSIEIDFWNKKNIIYIRSKILSSAFVNSIIYFLLSHIYWQIIYNDTRFFHYIKKNKEHQYQRLQSQNKPLKDPL